MEIINGQSNTSNNIIDLNQNVKYLSDISYDLTLYTITGTYDDEISLFRAKKFWAQAFNDVFLLEKKYDFNFKLKKDLNKFQLICSFVSACGRYAFWRINNNQNPEVKYLIEISHMPFIFQNYDEIINGYPNFKNSSEQDILGEVEEKTKNISDILKKIISKICKHDNEKK